jgi:methyl-accepting chemotaxis protein
MASSDEHGGQAPVLQPNGEISGSGSGSRVYQRPPWWRRKYLVNRDLQMRFAWSAVVVGLVSSCASSFMILLSFWSFNIWQGQRLPVPVMLTIMMVMITNVAGIYVVAVLTTQKIAGPLFNLLRQFKELSQANFSARLRLRKRDELQYVARRFNEMSESLMQMDRSLYLSLVQIGHKMDEGDVNGARHALGVLLESERFACTRKTING